MSATSRRQPPPGNPDTIANQSWEAGRSEIARWFRWSKAFFSSIPGGFANIAASIIQAGVDATSGLEASGWAASDHIHDVETATPANPTGATASEGTGTALMRADATIAQGIVTTKGDLLGHTSVPARVAVGANGTLLTADSTEATGVKWNTLSASIGYETGDLELLSWIL